MKHTPGPWMVEGESSNDGEGEVVTSSGRTICWTANTWDVDGDEEVITEEDRANARLIAAAPGMFAALRECSAALADLLSEVDPSGLECQEQWACVAECKAAIAKAEGRGE